MAMGARSTREASVIALYEAASEIPPLAVRHKAMSGERTCLAKFIKDPWISIGMRLSTETLAWTKGRGDLRVRHADSRRVAHAGLPERGRGQRAVSGASWAPGFPYGKVSVVKFVDRRIWNWAVGGVGW